MTPFGLVVSLSACSALLLSMHVCREGQGLCMISLLVCVCVCVCACAHASVCACVSASVSPCMCGSVCMHVFEKLACQGVCVGVCVCYMQYYNRLLYSVAYSYFLELEGGIPRWT